MGSSDYLKSWKQRNPERVLAAKKRYRQTHKEQIAAYQRDYYWRTGIPSNARTQAIREAKNKPCMDCGKSYPAYVMDFDHLGEKLFNIGSAVRERIVSLEAIQLEIAKCDVVCSNCHRERTFGKSRD